MKSIPAVVLCLLAITVSASGGSDPFVILEESRSIFSMLENEGLDSYIADVRISGTAVHDLLQHLGEGQQGVPAFKSYFKSPASWRIHYNYTPSQKENAVKVLNLMAPFYMAFSFTAKNQVEQIGMLKKDAAATQTIEMVDGVECLKIALTPSPGKDGIMLSSQPDGSRIVTKESIFWIDRKSGTVVRNVSTSCYIDNPEKTITTILNTEWSGFEGRTLPVFFEYILNDQPVHTQLFTYMADDGYIFPATRELVLYSAETVPFIGRILLQFDNYRPNAVIPPNIIK